MTARVLTGGKVSKKRGRSVAVAVIDGLPGGRIEAALAGGDPTPTVAQMRGVALGVGLALYKGARRVEVVTPSRAVARALHGEAGIDDYHGAHLAGWAIYWTRARCPDGWSVEVRPARDMPEVTKIATRALATPAAQETLL